MSAKLAPSGAATGVKMKKDSKDNNAAKPRQASLNGNDPVSAAKPSNDAHVNGDEATPSSAFVMIVEELLRNVLPKLDGMEMMEFRAVLEREVASALEAKGICECNPEIAAALKERRARLDALKECLNDITQVSDLNDIKRVASSRIKLLTKGHTYTKKRIKGHDYLYEIYWDANEKKKKYKYIGPAAMVEARNPEKNGTGKHG